MIHLVVIYTKARDFKYTMDSIKKNYTKDYKCTVLAPIGTSLEDDNISVLEYTNLSLLAGPINKSIESSDEDISIVIKSGTYITPNSITSLVSALDKENISMSVPKINTFFENQKHVFKSIFEKQLLKEAFEIRLLEANKCDYIKEIDDNIFAIKKSTFMKIGMLDENLKELPILYSDFLYRGFKIGLSAVVCKDALMYSRSLVDKKCFGEEAGIALNNKLGIQPGYFTGVRADLVNVIQENPLEDFKVLDVGCGAGYTLLSVKNKYKNAEIYGIEKVGACKNIASPLVNFIEGDCMEAINSFEDDSLDYIICSEILEKLIDPWEFIRICSKKISSTGKLIVSVNNMANIGVIFEILNGSFAYKNSGAQDINNIRFFTLNSILQLLTQNGFNVIEMGATSSNAQYEEQLINELVNTQIVNKQAPQTLAIASQLKVLQYNLICRKKED